LDESASAAELGTGSFAGEPAGAGVDAGTAVVTGAEGREVAAGISAVVGGLGLCEKSKMFCVGGSDKTARGSSAVNIDPAISHETTLIATTFQHCVPRILLQNAKRIYMDEQDGRDKCGIRLSDDFHLFQPRG
jgi:hypothetical protein